MTTKKKSDDLTRSERVVDHLAQQYAVERTLREEIALLRESEQQTRGELARVRREHDDAANRRVIERAADTRKIERLERLVRGLLTALNAATEEVAPGLPFSPR